MSNIQIANATNLFVEVDDEDFDYLNQYRWLVYAKASGFEYAVGQVDGKRTYMHRLLCGVPGLHVDHINGNTMDNRRSNLRAVTAGENARNRHTTQANNTGVTGVFREPRGNRFIAKSSAAGAGRVYLGSFATLEAAAAAIRTYEDALPTGQTVPELLRRIAQLEQRLAQLQGIAA